MIRSDSGSDLRWIFWTLGPNLILKIRDPLIIRPDYHCQGVLLKTISVGKSNQLTVDGSLEVDGWLLLKKAPNPTYESKSIQPFAISMNNSHFWGATEIEQWVKHNHWPGHTKLSNFELKDSQLFNFQPALCFLLTVCGAYCIPKICNLRARVTLK